MTDSEILELREAYETSGMKMVQFADIKRLDFEKTRYALRKALKLRREASGEISFTAIKTTQSSLPFNTAAAKHIVITTSDGTTIQIPI